MQDFSPTKLENAIFVVATPIGNLRDITLRALEVLQNADFIVCEDSRVTLKLLQHYKIKDKKFIIYNDHSDETVREKILNFLIQGHSIALVSDAGTPLISDPGYKLIRFLRLYNQKIIPIPGASSITSALSASGVACDNFLFMGFFPTSNQQKISTLKSLPKNYTAVFLESANRLESSLEEIENILGNRVVSVARELTKIHEEIITDEVTKVREFFTQNPDKLRGEIVLIIEKLARSAKELTEEELEKEIKNALNAGFSVKELSQNLAEIYGLNKKDIYQLALKITKS